MQGYWSGLPFASPGDLPGQGIKPKSLEAPAFIFHILFNYLSRLCQVLVVACGIQFPDQESNPRPLHQELRVLPTGLPGKSEQVD